MMMHQHSKGRMWICADKWCAQSEKSIFVGAKGLERQGVKNNQCEQKGINESKDAHGASKDASSVSININHSM